MDNCRGIVLGIFSDKRIAYYRFTKIPIRISLTHALINRIRQVFSLEMDVLPNLQKYHSHTSILTNWNHIPACNLKIILQLSQNLFPKRRLLCLRRTFHGRIHIR